MAASFRFLPDEKDHEATRLLPWVMAVMVYLSALSLTGGILIHNGFGNWTESLSNRLTVQISIEDRKERTAVAKEAGGLLEKTPGVMSVRQLSEAEINALLEPWLGEGNVTGDLPVPAMLDVQIDGRLAIDIRALESGLHQLSEKIHIDDHQKWLGHFVKLTRMVESVALGIFLLVILATIAIVIFGTKAGLAEHKETIKIMHLMGAEDDLVARAYQKRFMKHGLKGGLVGLGLALITIFGLARLVQNLAEGLVEAPNIPYLEMLLLLVLPVLSGLISMVTARITVTKELARIM
ncbi:cell division protein FtsX [Emcibacter sp.]|uniref:cell division protein FtsX n=1 Tax=Emcibacter sp. TaxID=1979954 RepID=UPI003A8F0B08